MKECRDGQANFNKCSTTPNALTINTDESGLVSNVPEDGIGKFGTTYSLTITRSDTSFLGDKAFTSLIKIFMYQI